MTGPLRLLCVLPDLAVGGAQRTMVNLINEFPAHGIEPTLVLTCARGPAERWLTNPDCVVALERDQSRHALWPLRREIGRQRPDLVFSTMVDTNILSAFAVLGRRNLPLIARETNSHRARGDLGFVRTRLIGWTYRNADKVVALSHGVEAELVADYQLDPGKTVTIHNPVDVATFATKREDRRGDDAPLIVTIGRLHRQKGFDRLIDAFARLANVSAHLVIIGDGPDRAKLEEQARRLGVADRVRFEGYLADSSSWLARADLFVSSSRWEGFGHVIVEAMAAGAPVVAVDCPHGPRDIITSDVNGILVSPGEGLADRLAAAIDRLLVDPANAKALAARGLQDSARFQPRSIAARYVQLFNQVLSARVEKAAV
jgi:glycosyltransferase involved in cell wall biosynthesis